MTSPAREPTFLPLTVSAARSAAATLGPSLRTRAAEVVQHRAEAADSAAAECWISLLAGCDYPGRHALPSRLRELTEATSVYAGTQWWHGDGSVHRRRVAAAEGRIDEAVRELDGEEFAEAFVGYDQALATVVVGVQSRMGTTAT
ncbi:hypothetical protein GCM10010174_22580 [Kutzneria viridogrisea]|uniref:SAV-6107-like HEPN domain-containing protein n=2 Tax=Kutzneria TaxID=43356 RepID=A0ABR6BTQ7_9PSEU|nr:hypothetical protein [Kutzneria albida]AHH94267.1 putative secreted protein [Kutzneria albida DSM 43870]MBA8929934.1 hypothetical protein [Kutzneria viridogrisea]